MKTLAKHAPQRIDFYSQRGVATLPISLILLILLTLITLYAARVGVLETRASANKVRYDEAFQAAEAGVEEAIAYANHNRATLINATWNSCSGITALPCGDGSNNIYGASWIYLSNITQVIQPTQGGLTVHLLTPCGGTANDGVCDSNVPYDEPPITVFAIGTSEDETGQAYVRQAAFFTNPGSGVGGVPVPLLAPNEILLNGSFDVVTNPNAYIRDDCSLDAKDKGKCNQPLSIWTKSDFDNSGGSAKTCYLEDFLNSKDSSFWDTSEADNIYDLEKIKCTQCNCSLEPITSASNPEGKDILDYDPAVSDGEGQLQDTTNFPDDVFHYVFGVPTSQYTVIKNMLAGQGRMQPNCDGITSSSSGYYWITGNCNPAGDIGSFDGPVLLIIEGNIAFSGNDSLFGVMFLFRTNPASLAEITANGTITLYGGMMSNARMKLPTGNFKARYTSTIFNQLQESGSGLFYGKLPGTWADYQN